MRMDYCGLIVDYEMSQESSMWIRIEHYGEIRVRIIAEGYVRKKEKDGMHSIPHMLKKKDPNVFHCPRN
jgi:hypothetical protein